MASANESSGGTFAGGETAGTGAGTAPGAPAGAARPVKVGITYPDTAAIAAAFGQESHDASDFIQKIVDYINKTGGIAGRPIAPVYHRVDLTEDGSAAGQRACTALTQDKKVDIVINGGVVGETLAACLGKAGVSVLDGANVPTDAEDERRLPNRFSPSGFRMDRSVMAILNGSAKQGRIKKGDTLGVVVEDCPGPNRIFSKLLLPRAQQLGLKVVQGTHKCVQNIVSDLGPVTNDIQREALRFASAGVTHVLMISGPEAFVVSRFTETASQQKYYPKYFVSSQAYPFNNSRSGATVKIAEDARPNVSGWGAIPLLDVGGGAKPANPQQLAAQQRCRKADPNEGLTRGSSSGDDPSFNRSVYLGLCDTFYALKAMLETNGVRYTLPEVTKGFHVGLGGDRTASANLTGGFFGAGPNRLDGVGYVRPFAYDTSRKVFVYIGDAVAVP